jgi:hypothetical protein
MIHDGMKCRGKWQHTPVLVICVNEVSRVQLSCCSRYWDNTFLVMMVSKAIIILCFHVSVLSVCPTAMWAESQGIINWSSYEIGLPPPIQQPWEFLSEQRGKAAERGQLSRLLKLQLLILYPSPPLTRPPPGCEETYKVLTVMSSRRKNVFGLRQNVISISTALQEVYIGNITNTFQMYVTS